MSHAATESAPVCSSIHQVFANPEFGARRVEVLSPATLYEPPSPAQNLYFIESGQVRIYQIGPDQSTRLADILGAGEWFGIAALAGSPAYGARATVVAASVLWALPAEGLREMLARQPEVAVEFVGQLARRLEAAHDAAARLMFDDCNQRLIQTLLRFSRSSAATPLDGGVVLRITHQQLAQAVGAARETVSLALTQLRQRKLLRTGRNRLMFNPLTLEQFSRRSIRAALTPVQENKRNAHPRQSLADAVDDLD